MLKNKKKATGGVSEASKVVMGGEPCNDPRQRGRQADILRIWVDMMVGCCGGQRKTMVGQIQQCHLFSLLTLWRSPLNT